MLKVSLGYINNAKVRKIHELDAYIKECTSKELVEILEPLRNSKNGISISVRNDNEHNTRVFISIRSKYFIVDMEEDKFKKACIVNKADYNNKADAIEALKHLIAEHNIYIEQNKKKILANAIKGEKYSFTVYDIGLFEGIVEAVDENTITFKNTVFIVSTHNDLVDVSKYKKSRRITFNAEDIAYINKSSVQYAV